MPLQGTLLGYRLAYRGQDTPEVGAAGWVGVERLWEEGTGEVCTVPTKTSFGDPKWVHKEGAENVCL